MRTAQALGSPPIVLWMSGSLDTSVDSEEWENITTMVLILKELAASTCKLNCLQISPWPSVSTQTEELKKRTVISVMLPQEENVLFTSLMAVTEKQGKKNQAFAVFVLELKSSCPRSVCPSLATFGKS